MSRHQSHRAHHPVPRASEGTIEEEEDAAAYPTAEAEGRPEPRYRPLHVLAALQELDQRTGDGAHALKDIVGLVNLPVSTVCRILRTAEDLGLVARPETGRYASAGSTPSAPLEEHDDRDNSLLMRLHQSTQAPALLYAPALLAGATTRILVSRVYGHRGAHVLRAPRLQQIALRQSPLRADPAGLAILAQLVPQQDLAPQLRPIRDAALAVGPSPISNLAMLAAPVWRGRTVAGCLAVLPPLEILNDEHDLTRVTRLLVTVAQSYSRRTTAEAASGEELDDAS